MRTDASCRHHAGTMVCLAAIGMRAGVAVGFGDGQLKLARPVKAGVLRPANPAFTGGAGCAYNVAGDRLTRRTVSRV
jgi:hypothetical protein